MRNLSRLGASIIAVLLVACGETTAETPKPDNKSIPTATWLAAGGGGGLTHNAKAIAPPPYRLRWSYLTDDVDRAAVKAGAIIVDDHVYVGDAKGTLHAINLKTGKGIWTYQAEDGFETTPLYSNGKLFLGDVDGIFHAVDAKTGQKVWTYDSKATIHSSANTDGEVIIFCNDEAGIFALDHDGKELWTAKAGDRVNAAPSISAGKAHIVGCDAVMLVLNVKDGKELMKVKLPALAPGSAAIGSQRIAVGTDQGFILCVDRAGKEVWKYQSEDKAMFYASPAMTDKSIIIGGRDRKVRAIDLKTGKKLWSFRTRGDVDSSPVVSGNLVIVGSRDKRLYVLDLKSGEKLWDFRTGRAVTATPAVAQGVIVAGDEAGNVYCFEPEK